MVAKKYELTKDYSFHGEFWHSPEDNKGRFSARIEYSPYHGLILDYCISDSDSINSCERLYGVLNTGESCTLIGPFNFTHGSYHFGTGIKTGRHGFALILFNGFYDEDTLIEYFDLSLHGLQEFIHPQGFITNIRYSKQPIFTTENSDWKLELINNASFSLIGDGLLNILDCRNEAALKKVLDDFQDTKNLYPESIFSIRKALTFYFRYKYKKSSKIKEYISRIWDISGLLSILIDKPVLPEELFFKFEDNKLRASCLLTMSFEQRTIDLALREIHHRFLPINWKVIDIDKVFYKWFEMAERYVSLTVTYQYETGFRTLHQAHADIILFATQLEAINMTLHGSKYEKYIKPINEYASPLLKQRLDSFFSKINNDSLGANIATLRNELAHVDREKKLMRSLNIDDYIKIGMYLKLIVTSHLLSDLGIEKDKIEKYQNDVAPE
ncbi:ApeA N-terminal domain 1-containing protein [Enterobacter hormaechei]